MHVFVQQYVVVGRALNGEENTLYKYQVFAPNEVVAKSRFWRLMREKHKVKSTHGEVVQCRRLPEKKIAARNYSIDLCYYCQKVGYTTMTKEVRDVSKAGAVSQVLSHMASQHRARFNNIEVLSVRSISNDQCKRAAVKQFHPKRLSFPVLNKSSKPNRKSRALIVTKSTSRRVV